MKVVFTDGSSPDRFADDMPTDAELVAHVLRRCTFGPTEHQLRRFDGSTPAAVVEALLGDPPTPATTIHLDDPDDENGDDPTDRTIRWWLDRMRDDDGGGLQERMVWFWHGHLTTSLEKVDHRPMIQQIHLLRRHALGNFRTLMQEMTLDPAMLVYLDGNWSDAAAPNENYSRELMELFTLGRHSGAYTEADVRAGAQALAGWWVEDHDDDDRPLDEPYAVFEPELALRHPVTFLGRRVQTAAEVVDAVCDHPACASFVVGELHEYFVGAQPQDERRRELAEVFTRSGLEIRPVVEAIVRHDSFLDAAGNRPRTPIEWWLALERLIGGRIEYWALHELGQLPLHPPNVAGWPDPDRWLAGGAVLTKAQLALDRSWDTETLGDRPVAEVVRRAGLPSLSDATRSTLEAIADGEMGRRERATLLHATVAMSPDFNVG